MCAHWDRDPKDMGQPEYHLLLWFCSNSVELDLHVILAVNLAIKEPGTKGLETWLIPVFYTHQM